MPKVRRKGLPGMMVCVTRERGMVMLALPQKLFMLIDAWLKSFSLPRRFSDRC